MFRQIEPEVALDCVIASNTSGLPIDALAEAFEQPDRFLGIHYFFPADIVPAVEVVWGARTRASSSDVAVDLLHRSGREAMVVEEPVIGKVVNRLHHAILHEAYDLLTRGLVDVRSLDMAAKYILGPRMCVSGLLKQKDLGRLEGHIRAQQAIVPDLCHDPTPNPMVQKMLADGHLGSKAGRGFYDGSGRDPDEVSRNPVENLAGIVSYLKTLKDDDSAK